MADDDYRDFPPSARPKPKTRPVSPTARSMLLMRSRGAMVAKTERWNPFAKSFLDLFSFGDILCVEPGKVGCTAIQSTTRSNQAARLRKFQTEKVAKKIRVWLRAKNRLILHGWSKRGAAGTRKLWYVTEREIVKEDLA